jgi:hypothetical protein
MLRFSAAWWRAEYAEALAATPGLDFRSRNNYEEAIWIAECRETHGGHPDRRFVRRFLSPEWLAGRVGVKSPRDLFRTCSAEQLRVYRDALAELIEAGAVMGDLLAEVRAYGMADLDAAIAGELDDGEVEQPPADAPPPRPACRRGKRVA